MTRRELLADWKNRHHLSNERLAKLASSSVWSVKSWLRPPSSQAARLVSDRTLELIALRLGERLPRLPDERKDYAAGRSHRTTTTGA